MGNKLKIELDCEELDEVIEKANQLSKLLREAQQIIDSLAYRKGEERIRDGQ